MSAKGRDRSGATNPEMKLASPLLSFSSSVPHAGSRESVWQRWRNVGLPRNPRTAANLLQPRLEAVPIDNPSIHLYGGYAIGFTRLSGLKEPAREVSLGEGTPEENLLFFGKLLIFKVPIAILSSWATCPNSTTRLIIPVRVR